MLGKLLTDEVNQVLQNLAADIDRQRLQLPSPPDVLVDLSALIAHSDTGSQEIADLLQRDPHISARLIKIANSVLFGNRTHVSSLKAAVGRLGFAKVQSLVSGLAITQHFLINKRVGIEKQCLHAWLQSIRVASVSSVLARNRSDIDPDVAMLAGLVHNIGMLPLLLRLNDIERLRRDRALMYTVSEQVIAQLYPATGRMILDSWNFSPDIVRITQTHLSSQHQQAGKLTLDDLVFIAHQLHRVQNFTRHFVIPQPMLAAPAFATLWPNEIEAIAELHRLQAEIDLAISSLTH